MTLSCTHGQRVKPDQVQNSLVRGVVGIHFTKMENPTKTFNIIAEMNWRRRKGVQYSGPIQDLQGLIEHVTEILETSIIISIIFLLLIL